VKNFQSLLYDETDRTRHGLGFVNQPAAVGHDIIVQQHRGEIKVETEEGKFTEFVVRLPKNG